ncbi:conserved Plasmodium protein, unknown function [Babesia microti strain RI]|uniref:Uncharacterized protein n=1 Tax=Babesia microti (strain RI) TaxID=1133968 RepID=A0A1R4AAF2_BABMR|nr:conserved Plasmodium protein, unknown function [Babesia microti strain RI]SJK85989.1 conserved Plasmodium protein, unknown function [Babesia microti strain RI]|eukprot:XP_021338189.1 conserved Plasmodium protein, unknown function [Babesia microti strain RI]
MCLAHILFLAILFDPLVAFNSKRIEEINCRLFNVAPPGSKYLRNIDFIERDPATNYPWNFCDKNWTDITREISPGYNFLTDEWAYMQHECDPNNPSGVFMGGPQNYTGMGLQLTGLDRHRVVPRPYVQDHGHRWREKVEPGTISFDISPDCNQEVKINEDEMDLERRTWGSWSQPGTTIKMNFDNAFRGYNTHENDYELLYPISSKYEDMQTWPLYYDKPSTTVPVPEIEWILAALGRFIGYISDPNWSTDRLLSKQKRLLREWDEEEELWKKTRKTIHLKRIEHIKNMLFSPNSAIMGINTGNRKGSENKIEKLCQEVAMENSRRILKQQLTVKECDPDYLRKIYNRIDVSFEAGSADCPEAECKTECINVVAYTPYEMPNSWFENMTVEEMAEAYHQYMIEIRGHGRHYLMDEIPGEDRDMQYSLRNDIYKFPRLAAEYRPIWANKKFGEEFGDAIHDQHLVPIQTMSTFGSKIDNSGKNADLNTLNYAKDFDSYRKINYNSENNS